MELTLIIDGQQARLTLPDHQGQLVLGTGKPTKTTAPHTTLWLKAGRLIGIDTLPAGKQADRFIQIQPGWDVEVGYLAQRFSDVAVDRGSVKVPFLTGTVPGHLVPAIDAFVDQIMVVLQALGFDQLFAKPVKKGPAKAQHRWRKELADVAFQVAYDDSEATVYWQKRNEMRIEKGATLRATARKNKDGSTGLGERMGERIRLEHAAAIDGTTTTEDVVLKSVNEVGLFLYFGGTNGWLQLKNNDGVTLDALSVVE